MGAILHSRKQRLKRRGGNKACGGAVRLPSPRALLPALVPVYVAALLFGACLALSGRALAQPDSSAAPAVAADSAPAAAPGAKARQESLAKRKFINSGILRPNIKPPPKQEPDFPAFSTAVFVPKFFDSHERFERVDLSSHARLRFATTVDFFPFNYSDKNGILAGYNIDLVRALCAELRVENICQIEAVPWPDLERRLQGGGVDALIAGIAPTIKNRDFLRFSRAYMRFPARFIALRGSAMQKDSQNFMRLGYDFSEFLMLRGATVRVGIIRNTAHEKMLAEYFTPQAQAQTAAANKDRPKNALQLSLFADEQELLEALKAGKIDLAFGDGMSFALMMNKQEEPKAGEAPTPAAIAAAKELETAAPRFQVAAASDETAFPAAQPAAAAPAATAAKSETCCVFVGGAYMGLGYLGQGMRIATAEKDQKLASALNYALQQLERKGKLAELYLRYFPVGFY